MAIAPQPISLPQHSALPSAQPPEPVVALGQPRSRFAQATLAPIHAWHLLSLDAPSVATLWAFCFARAFHLTLSPYALPLLFVGTWLLYIADRVLDGFRHDHTRLRDRHFFYMRHRSVIVTISVPVCAFLAWIIFFHMLPAARRADILIFTIVSAYFALVHLRGPGIERWFPKELIVALVFASATAVPALVRIASPVTFDPSRDKAILLFMSALFAALCWLNCVAIEKWEQPSRYISRRVGILAANIGTSDRTTQWGQHHLRTIGFALALAAILAAALLLPSNGAAASLCIAAAASALLLIALDRSPLSTFHLRIAADAALLTPLLVLFVR